MSVVIPNWTGKTGVCHLQVDISRLRYVGGPGMPWLMMLRGLQDPASKKFQQIHAYFKLTASEAHAVEEGLVSLQAKLEAKNGHVLLRSIFIGDNERFSRTDQEE